MTVITNTLNEEDGSESIYLDHPVTGVTWVGTNIYANQYGWSTIN